MRHTLLILQSTTNTYQVEWAKPHCNQGCGHQLYSNPTNCSLLRIRLLYSHIQMRAIVVTVGGVALVEDKAAVIVEGEPEEDWRARREVKRIAPVIERSRAGDSKEPRAAIIVDGVGEQLVTCK